MWPCSVQPVEPNITPNIKPNIEPNSEPNIEPNLEPILSRITNQICIEPNIEPEPNIKLNIEPNIEPNIELISFNVVRCLHPNFLQSTKYVQCPCPPSYDMLYKVLRFCTRLYIVV